MCKTSQFHEWYAKNTESCLARNKRYRDENPEKRCAQYKAWSAKHTDKVREKHRQWRLDNPDKVKENNRRWKQENPEEVKGHCSRRRARIYKVSGSHTTEEWGAIIAKQRSKCAHCGKKYPLERDHIVPLSKGGTNFAFNIQGLCKSCNCKKHTKIEPGTPRSLFDAT